MGIIQEVRTDRKEPNVLTFADLAHIPGVEVPDSIDGITSDWFNRQKEHIEEKIRIYQSSSILGVEMFESRRLNERIERLRIFTESVLRSREAEKKKKPKPPVQKAKTKYEESIEYSEAVKRNEEHVEKIIAKRKKEEELTQFVESLKKEK